MTAPSPGDFMRAIAAESWSVGWSDCVGAVARWLALRGHAAALAALPVAGDEVAAAEALLFAGGLAATMTAAAERLGLVRGETAAEGDVAHLVLADGRETAAIRGRGAWLVRTGAGLGIVRDGAVAAATIWRS